MELIKNNNEIALLDIRNLVVHYVTDSGVVEALNDISLTINKGETLGLVGETGAGKTTIAKSIMGLLPVPPSKIVQGEIFFEGKDLTKLKKKEYCNFRGRKASMIFQDPMTALNPLKTVGVQIAEVIERHERLKGTAALERAKEMLEIVGIPAERCYEYPHQFSGGMKQRVVIAIALACKPELLIADEPTTALDVTIQAQVLNLMKELRNKYQTAMMLITHDLGIVVDVCDKCAIIYAGEIVEYGSVKTIFVHPLHPYTNGLFDSLPSLNKEVKRLKPIPGLMSDPMNLPSYCSFYDRCEYKCDSCKNANPQLEELESGHFVKCFRAREFMHNPPREREGN